MKIIEAPKIAFSQYVGSALGRYEAEDDIDEPEGVCVEGRCLLIHAARCADQVHWISSGYHRKTNMKALRAQTRNSRIGCFCRDGTGTSQGATVYTPGHRL